MGWTTWNDRLSLLLLVGISDLMIADTAAAASIVGSYYIKAVGV